MTTHDKSQDYARRQQSQMLDARFATTPETRAMCVAFWDRRLEELRVAYAANPVKLSPEALAKFLAVQK